MLALLALLILGQPAVSCPDVSACRAAAMEAHARKDFEAFHDLAWAAYGKGRKNDPELMLLVARAQSLSGRPGDALVMLERIVALGGATDAATSEDFTRVRALPRWDEVAGRFSAMPAAPAEPPAPAAKKPPASAEPPSTTVTKPAPPAEPPAPAVTKPTPPVETPAASAKADAPPAKPSATPGKLKFTTLLTPSAVVYDGVSRRFIIADRQARRIAVIDETTGQVATLVGAQGALGDIGGIAIDPQRGDLWVISATETGTVLHRMQLISGRVLSTIPLEQIQDPVVAMAFAPGSGLVVGDSTGTVWRVRAGGRSDKLAALEYVPRTFAADPAGRLYVGAGAPRLARFSLGASLRRIDTIDLDGSIPADAPFVVAGKRLHFIVPVDGSFEIRSFPVR